MIFWTVLLLLLIVPVFIVVKRKNYITLLLTFSPYLFYTFYEVSSECIATNNTSEACVWGYMNYIYAIIIGCFLYLLVTVVQIVISKFRVKTEDAQMNH